MIPMRILLALSFASFLAACTTNPVTGKKQLDLVSESQELAIGQEQYEPAQQSQGGAYTLDPELTMYVRGVGEKLAAVSDQPDLPYEFVVLNNDVPNAWALPSGKIAINRGLLTKFDNEAQLAAVIGHEIVHAAARHGAQRMQNSMLVSAGMAGLGLAMSNQEYGQLLVGGAALGSTLALAKYGRNHELESDHYGMEYMVKAGYDPQAAVELQKIFVELSEGNNPSWIQGMFATHPPSQDRVEANAEHAKQLKSRFPEADYRGEQAFMKATARTRRAIPAYEAYNKGLKALSEGNTSEAMTLAEQAIKIEPEEGKFHQLKGDVYAKLGNEKLALQNYDKAISLNPEYFEPLLKRGLVRQATGQLAGAERDLQKANQLLPTSVGHLAMGDISMSKQQPRQAIEYYKVAAQAEGRTGDIARSRLSQFQ
ncbi:M48 family metalloprotease [Allohahella marinimesophila]|uniref:M48 family metallopeptidase n=1 Tax=Allohahella marinimesophila TaxID=1054972 RepID=A0ABP7NNH4_9GAMM